VPRRAVPGREDLPLVSVVLPVLNEEAHIQRCLASVQAQDYPAEMIEIVVADGGSTDRTRAIVERIAASDRRISLVDNPGRNQAAGLNRAIAASTGTIVARLDGHAAWPPSHISRCVQLLETTGADNVGGTMQAVGDNTVARVAARASSSPFGIGGARYRYADREVETDTVFLGCFRRAALERVGRYDERLPPHEDYELNQRIRARGGRIVFSPDLPTTYWARDSWKGLARQFYRYGRAKARGARLNPTVLRPYHLVPPATVAAVPILAGLCLWPTGRRLAAVVAGAYCAACVAASVPAGRGQPLSVRALIPLAFPVLHGSWGTGFVAGLIGPGVAPAEPETARHQP
jgi:succinoglycan biosynthesis protein ExoA